MEQAVETFGHRPGRDLLFVVTKAHIRLAKNGPRRKTLVGFFFGFSGIAGEDG